MCNNNNCSNCSNNNNGQLGFGPTGRRCRCRCNCRCRNNWNNWNRKPIPCSECCSGLSDGCPKDVNCSAIPVVKTKSTYRKRDLCCDCDGTCGLYPTECRNTYWPPFAKPRWLPCDCLYCRCTK